MINKKKICGILQEKIEKSHSKYLIVGIGLNLIKSPDLTNYPTTNLFAITNRKINNFDKSHVLKTTANQCLSNLPQKEERILRMLSGFGLHNQYDCKEIAKQEIRFNKGKWKQHAKTDQKAMYLVKSHWEGKSYVDYNPWGTVTGRLGLNQGSFPILNLKNTIKDIVVPKWDCFVELDFNGAELRTLLHLSGYPQPHEDIHDWNQINIFNNTIERADAKKKIFAWLYNPTSTAVDTDYYDKSKVLEKHYEEGIVTTPFGRTIPSDDFHSLNYLIQSTSSDNFLDRASAIQKYCKRLKTNVAFLVHDSIVLDVPLEEKERIKEIEKELGQ